MLVTDPPYNVNYHGGTSEHMTIANDNLSESAFLSFLTDAFKAADTVLKPGAGCYVWHPCAYDYIFKQALATVGWKYKQILIWAKQYFTLGRLDYQYQHEPCIYLIKPGAPHFFRIERTNSSVIKPQQLDDMTREQLIECVKDLMGTKDKNPTSILDAKKPAKNIEHPTMKPVELFADHIHNSSLPGQIVLDIFGGSGTTIIACEQLGRKARVMELDPKYCDAIISRWEKHTGKTAKLEVIQNGTTESGD